MTVTAITEAPSSAAVRPMREAGGVAITKLTPAQQEAFAAARLYAVELAPYFAHAIFALTPLAAHGLGTFAVDRHWRLYMDPECFQAWHIDQCGTVLLHEVGHCIRQHASRFDDLGSDASHQLWNLAGDAAINDDLLSVGFPLPDGCVTPQSFGCEPGDLEENYYKALVTKYPPPPPAGGSGDGTDPGKGGSANPGSGDATDAAAGQGDDAGGYEGCGSGAGDPAAAWELPGDDPAAPAVQPADADLVRRQVAQDVRDQARAKGRGSVPAGLVRWADEVLAPPTVPWQQVLRAAVRRAMAHAAGIHTTTYRKPGRRRIDKVVTPAYRKPLVSVAAVIDTSGSMSGDDLAACMAEVEGVCKASRSGQRLSVIAVDSAAASAQKVVRASQVTLTGGGGTDMRVGIDAAAKLKPKPDVTVVMTDGFTPWPLEPNGTRLIVAIVGSPENRAAALSAWPPPAWATVVEVPAGGAE